MTSAIRKQNVSQQAQDPGDSVTCKANVAITGKRFVKVGAGSLANRQNINPCGAGDRAHGISHRDAAAGESVSVIRRGTWSVTAGGTITSGDPLAAGALGVAVLAAGAAAVLGTASNDAVAGGDVFVILP
ncbi:DUF2190 family protein [Nakamurella silvestris]|nr:DUF2190 family protein [Nakamurella silvestris]